MRWSFRQAMRARNRDLEPVEHDQLLPAKAFDEIVQLQREFGNQAVAHWIARRAQFRRLTPAEQREQTETRPQEIERVLAWSEANLPEAAAEIARIFGLSELERQAARCYGELLGEIELAETLERLDCAPELDDRTRTALQLVLRTLKRRV